MCVKLKLAVDMPNACGMQAQQAQRWLQLEGGVKQHIRQSLLATLPAKVSLIQFSCRDTPCSRHTMQLAAAAEASSLPSVCCNARG